MTLAIPAFHCVSAWASVYPIEKKLTNKIQNQGATLLIVSRQVTDFFMRISLYAGSDDLLLQGAEYRIF